MRQDHYAGVTVFSNSHGDRIASYYDGPHKLIWLQRPITRFQVRQVMGALVEQGARVRVTVPRTLHRYAE